MGTFKLKRVHLTIALVVIAVLFIGYIVLNGMYGFVQDQKITDYIYDGVVVCALAILFLSWKLQKDELAEKAKKREEEEASAAAREADGSSDDSSDGEKKLE